MGTKRTSRAESLALADEAQEWGTGKATELISETVLDGDGVLWAVLGDGRRIADPRADARPSSDETGSPPSLVPAPHRATMDDPQLQSRWVYAFACQLSPVADVRLKGSVLMDHLTSCAA